MSSPMEGDSESHHIAETGERVRTNPLEQPQVHGKH